MTPEASTNMDERQLIEQGSPPTEPPPVTPPTTPAPPVDERESGREEPPLATPPAPPSNSVAATLRGMPPGWRWALGIGLAFFSGLSWDLLIAYSNSALSIVSIGVMFAFALAAGFVLGVWWMVPLLAIPAYIGGWLGAPFGAEPFDMFGLLLLPILLFLLIGAAIGQRQGVAGERIPWAPWLPAISLAVGGGFLAQLFSFGAGWLSVLFAVTCLAATWLVRSWWGLIAVPAVYVGVAALIQILYGGGIENFSVTNFALYIALPAVVMSAIGMALARWRGTAVEQSRELAVEKALTSWWVVAIALVVLGALFASIFGGGGAGMDVFAMLVASLFAVTCLVAGWLLRSWWGLIATAGVYVAVAALMRSTMGGDPTGAGVLSVEFTLTIVLPAIVMSAIGTAIGMYRARHRGGEQLPQREQPAT